MDEQLKLYVASQLRLHRKAAGLNQVDLAEKIGRTSEAISNIERAKSLPALDTLLAIARVLDVPVRVFFPDAEESDTRSAARVRIDAEGVALLRGLSDERARIALGQLKALADS